LLRYVGEITPPATLQTGRTSGPSSSRRWEKHVCRIWGRHYVRPFIRTKAIKKPRTEPGLKFTFQRGTNRCLHNGPEYDARYNCSRSIKRRCQDFSHVAVQIARLSQRLQRRVLRLRWPSRLVATALSKCKNRPAHTGRGSVLISRRRSEVSNFVQTAAGNGRRLLG
jgi:hypothetical protein